MVFMPNEQGVGFSGDQKFPNFLNNGFVICPTVVTVEVVAFDVLYKALLTFLLVNRRVIL